MRQRQRLADGEVHRDEELPRRVLRRLGLADSDGTIAGYAWDFGDDRLRGQPVPARTTPTRLAATYTVTLTVTDDDGGVRHDQPRLITVAAANVAPTARFSSGGGE